MARTIDLQDPLNIIRILKYEEIRTSHPDSHRRKGKLASLVSVLLDRPEKAIIGAAHHAVADLMLWQYYPERSDAYLAKVFLQRSKIPDYTKNETLENARMSALLSARHEGKSKISKSLSAGKELFEGQALFFLSSYLLNRADKKAKEYLQIGLQMARMVDQLEDPDATVGFVYESMMNNGAADADWSLEVADAYVL
jgi:hypothetical protein